MKELTYILIGALVGIAGYLLAKDQLEAKRERDAEKRKNAARLILMQFNKQARK